MHSKTIPPNGLLYSHRKIPLHATGIGQEGRWATEQVRHGSKQKTSDLAGYQTSDQSFN